MSAFQAAPARGIRRRLAAAFLCAVALMGFVSAARADISSSDLSALGDADYATRHAATKKLLSDDSLTPQMIAKAYQAATSAEQKHRLMTVARHHVIRRMRENEFREEQPQRGALGVNHGPVTSDQLPDLHRSAVIVRRTLPGFPAHAAMEAGDLILAIDGEPIPTGITTDQITTYFVDKVQKINAGSTGLFTIYRDGKTIEVKVAAVSQTALRLMYNTGGLEDRHQRAWVQFRDAMEKGK